MSSSVPDSFFVPDTPPTTTPPTSKSEKAAWEILPTVQGPLFPSARKMTNEEAKLYKALMDTSSDSDSSIKTPKKMSPEGKKFFKEVTGDSYGSDNSDDSVEVLDKQKLLTLKKKWNRKINNRKDFKKCKVFNKQTREQKLHCLSHL